MNGLHAVIGKYCDENGIVWGVSDGNPISLPDGAGISIPFVPYGTEERLDPGKSLEGVKSVIVFGVPADKNIYGGLKGIIAPTMGGRDYHRRLYCIINGLIDRLSGYNAFRYAIQVDSGPLAEREYAALSGIGRYGKNRSIVNQRLGSAFNIGLLLTDMDIKRTGGSSFALKCEGCGLCIKSCPTGALGENAFNYKLCRSYLTQKRGVLSSGETDMMGISIYGCDICLGVCPYNKGLFYMGHNSDDAAAENLISLLYLPRKGYDAIYKDSNFYWRGRNTILRNAIISLAKTGRGHKIIEAHLNSASETIRETAENMLSLYT